MSINWDGVIKIASSLLAVVAAWALKTWSERGPKVIAYYGHSSSVRMPPNEGASEVTVHTHSVVVRNVGNKTARNVRVSHHTLPPSFSLYPAVAYSLELVPNAGGDIVMPTLVPGQQVTINYVYFPPLLFTNVTSGVRTDFSGALTVIHPAAS